jgi:hypothetical protein
MRRRSAACLALLALPLAAAAQEANLEWKFKEGMTLYQLTTNKMQQKVSVAGMNQELPINQQTLVKLTVKKVNPDKSVELEQTTVRSKTEGLPFGGVDEKLKGLTYTFTLGPDRKVTKFDGAEELKKRFANEDEQTKQMLGAMFREEVMKRGVEENFAMLPGKTVKVGEQWKRSSTFPLGPLGKMKMDVTYTYKGKAKHEGAEVDQVDYTAKLEWTGSEDAGEGAPFKIVKGKLEAKEFAGKFFYDAAKGHPVHNETSTKLGGTLTVAVGGMELEMSLEMDQKTTVKVSDKATGLDD